VERALLGALVDMLDWTQLAAYLSIVAALCGGGIGLCWLLLWRE
jgi:hypothetical protein